MLTESVFTHNKPQLGASCVLSEGNLNIKRIICQFLQERIS